MNNRLFLILFSTFFLPACITTHSVKIASLNTQITDVDSEIFACDKLAHDFFRFVKKGTTNNCIDNQKYGNSLIKWTEKPQYMQRKNLSNTVYWIEHPLVSSIGNLVAQRGLEGTAEIIKKARKLAAQRCGCDAEKQKRKGAFLKIKGHLAKMLYRGKVEKWCIAEQALMESAKHLKVL